jgi:hypothetical protein
MNLGPGSAVVLGGLLNSQKKVDSILDGQCGLLEVCDADPER